MGMKLRFLFRSLYVSKENVGFNKFTTFPEGSDFPDGLSTINCYLFH